MNPTPNAARTFAASNAREDAPARLHELRTWPEHFAAVLDGSKPYEVRVDDRGFAVGDLVRLAEYEPPRAGDLGHFTGREVTRRVTHVLAAGTFGLRPGYVALGLARVAGDGAVEVAASAIVGRWRVLADQPLTVLEVAREFAAAALDAVAEHRGER